MRGIARKGVRLRNQHRDIVRSAGRQRGADQAFDGIGDVLVVHQRLNFWIGDGPGETIGTQQEPVPCTHLFAPDVEGQGLLHADGTRDRVGQSVRRLGPR